MTPNVIEARDLSKRYRLGTRREPYRMLGASLLQSCSNAVGRVSRTLRGIPAPRLDDFWALRDVSFDVRRGEVVGVIGRNGAGKSTLLKILSRITDPTEGRATIRGRVGSLLEVGTGFHLELTGRENVYLNGSILGMRRSEIARKFDEIVAFAEVERFVDTQVKHYSSGMHLRLAFAVAAHLEPEILLVDEVLAVGDVAFQRKCLGKMGEVAAQGRTVLFVSHNLGAVKELCETALVLSAGRVTCRGTVAEGLTEYGRAMIESDQAGVSSSGWKDVRVNDVPLGEAAAIDADEEITVTASLGLGSDVEGGRLFCIVEDGAGHTLLHCRHELGQLGTDRDPSVPVRLAVDIPRLWLAPGVYSLYFKFIGRSSAGADVRHLSERALLDVNGSVVGLGRALLAPTVRWRASHGSTPVIAAGAGQP